MLVSLVSLRFFSFPKWFILKSITLIVLLTLSKKASLPLFIINSSGSFSSKVIIFTLRPTLSSIGMA